MQFGSGKLVVLFICFLFLVVNIQKWEGFVEKSRLVLHNSQWLEPFGSHPLETGHQPPAPQSHSQLRGQTQVPTRVPLTG